MKAVIALMLAVPLSGCWFVFIPGSVISGVGDALGGYEGRHCVGESAKVGDKIRHDNGTTGTVQKLEGYSTRCNTSGRPIRALVAID